MAGERLEKEDLQGLTSTWPGEQVPVPKLVLHL